MVFIFDEYYRSQFGENHKAIKNFFPQAQLFGFTGTPIFEENFSQKIREGQYETYKTTQSIFEKCLHRYTIIHAIKEIIADYNLQYGTNHSIHEFDGYYQDVQSRIKYPKYSKKNYPPENKIDITIVVDMLLIGLNGRFIPRISEKSRGARNIRIGSL